MKRLLRFLSLRVFALVLLGSALGLGCGRTPAPEGDPQTVLVTETSLHEKPDRLSPKVTTLRYGQQVIPIPRKSIKIAEGWIEVYADRDHSGFMRKSALGTLEAIETLRHLQESIEGIEPQASGLTTVPTYFRLEPGRGGKAIEKLPAGTRFEVFQRQATLHSKPNVGIDFAPPQKDVWYKIRLADRRVGYIFTKNFRLEPPAEILKYVQFRRPIAWLTLKTVQGEEFGSAKEYLVAYATPGKDFGADFDRLEIYHWDGKQYQTVMFLSSLRGILPIRTVREDDAVYFEFAELDPERKAQVIVHRYPYAYPYKKIGSTALQQDVGLH